MPNAQYYINTSSKDTLDKNISPVGNEFTINLFLPSDLLNPVFMVHSKPSANYIHVNGMGYYYINNITYDSQCVYLHCEKDVLMSNNAEIKNLTCLIARNETDKNDYIIDSSTTFTSNKQIICKKFGDDVIISTDNYILGVI